MPKMWRGILRQRRVLQITFSKNPVAFEHDVTVGHASYVIANGAVQAVPANLLAGLLANFLRMLQIKIEQILQQLLRSDVRLMNDRIAIKIFVEILAQFEIQRAARGAVLDEWLGKSPHLVGGPDFGGVNQPFTGRDDVGELHVNDGADGEIAATFIRRV